MTDPFDGVTRENVTEADEARATAAIERLLRVVPAIDDLMRDLRNLAQPASATDQTGTVTARANPEGLPESITVNEGWLRTVGVDGFAAAVAEACRNAALASLMSLSTPESQAVMTHVDAVLDYIGGAPPAPGLYLGPPTPPAPPEPATGAAGSLDQMQATVEHLLRSADGEATPPLVTGAGAQGRLTLTLDPGLGVTCVAEPDWLRRQDAYGLGEALAAAVASLRANHRAADPLSLLTNPPTR